jgi:copper resistance protein D
LWARWLELRLVPTEGVVAGRVWRACFVLVGLLLVLYREI